ncbi:MAG: alpha/beta hydrolase [Verrucomicrobiota bacterium]
MKILASILVVAFLATNAFSQRSYPPRIDGADEHIYKKIDEVELKLWAFSPEEDSDNARPAMLFFFGGGWRSGSPIQFVPHSQYLSKRGMVGIVVDYRVASRHQTKAKACVEDARDAVRFLRKHASELGVDPDKILVGGGSAGGHIAACLGVIAEDPESKPVAMALFNPACVLAPYEGAFEELAMKEKELSERMGVPVKDLSPIHHVSDSSVPAVIFHGTEDKTVPYVTAAKFAEVMKAAGVKCVLHSYEGEGHGFFNANRQTKEGSDPVFPKTLEQLDAFLVELGVLEAE